MYKKIYTYANPTAFGNLSCICSFCTITIFSSSSSDVDCTSSKFWNILKERPCGVLKSPASLLSSLKKVKQNKKMYQMLQFSKENKMFGESCMYPVVSFSN